MSVLDYCLNISALGITGHIFANLLCSENLHSYILYMGSFHIHLEIQVACSDMLRQMIKYRE